MAETALTRADVRRAAERCRDLLGPETALSRLRLALAGRASLDNVPEDGPTLRAMVAVLRTGKAVRSVCREPRRAARERPIPRGRVLRRADGVDATAVSVELRRANLEHLLDLKRAGYRGGFGELRNPGEGALVHFPRALHHSPAGSLSALCMDAADE